MHILSGSGRGVLRQRDSPSATGLQEHSIFAKSQKQARNASPGASSAIFTVRKDTALCPLTRSPLRICCDFTETDGEAR